MKQNTDRTGDSEARRQVKRHLWVVEIKHHEEMGKKWHTTVGVGLSRDDARRKKTEWEGRNPDDKFRIMQYGYVCYEKLLFLFFLSVACFPSACATPTPLCNQNGDLIYLQQERTGEINEWSIRKTELSMRRDSIESGELAGSTISAQDEPRIATLGHNSGAGRSNEQPRSGERDRTDYESRLLGQNNLDVQPAEIACLQRVATPAQSVFQEEKISPAELFARLLWEHVPKWKEPTLSDLRTQP